VVGFAFSPHLGEEIRPGLSEKAKSTPSPHYRALAVRRREGVTVERPAPSPRITEARWGRLELDDGRSFKDAKLFPGGAREWNWRETGTRHVPGIQPADVEELLERGARVVVLSRGVWKRLRVCPETLQALERRDVPVRRSPSAG
jgi:hypothetical protein